MLCLILATGLWLGLPFPASNKIEFAPPEHLSGTFFYNFENRILFLCPAYNCGPTGDNDYALKCPPTVCDAVTRLIRANAKPPDETVNLKLDLVGRRSHRQDKAQFFAYSDRSISVVRVEQVKLVPAWK